MLASKLVSRVFQSYWRRSRGLVIEVQCCIADDRGGVLLVKDTQRGRWTLPGTKVHAGESATAALRRMLRSLQIDIAGVPPLACVQAPANAQSAYVALYTVDEWRRQEPPQPETGSPVTQFFAVEALPFDADSRARDLVRNVAARRQAEQT